MKRIYAAIASIAIIGLTSCGESASNKIESSGDSVSTMNEDPTLTPKEDSATMNPSANAQPLDAKGKDFVGAASSGGKMEVALGQIAEKNGNNERVKNFGAMMVRDHSAANNELLSVASRKDYTDNTEMMDKHKMHVDHLGKMEGTAFDKAYMKMMVDDHKKDIAEFEKAEKEVNDPDVKAFIAKTLPTLRTHLDSATAIMKSMK